MSEKLECGTRDVDPLLFEEISDAAVLAKEPLASVKMTTYNHAPYITQAIEGVLLQRTTFPIELVIGEDCSTDHTRDIVLDYQRKHPDIIRVIAWRQNVGGIRNGLHVDRACRGKYIAFCDGDDFWHHPQKLQMQVDYLEGHPRAGLVHTDADWLVDQTGETIPCWHRRHHTITQGDIYEDLLVANQIIACTACARKEHIERIGSHAVWKRRFLMGDSSKWLLISMAAQIGYLNISTATRRELVNSASKSPDIRKNFAFFLSNYDVKEYFCQLRPPSSSTQELIQSNFHKKKLRYGYLMQDGSIARDSYAYLAKWGLLAWTDRLHALGSRGKAQHIAAKAMLAVKDRIRNLRSATTCPMQAWKRSK